jgi:hypothetical protein
MAWACLALHSWITAWITIGSAIISCLDAPEARVNYYCDEELLDSLRAVFSRMHGHGMQGRMRLDMDR